MNWQKVWLLCVALAGVITTGYPALAKDKAAPVADVEAVSAAQSGTPDETQRFLQWADTYFAARFHDDQAFAGLGLVVVEQGKEPVYRTYGYASAVKDPIKPQWTRFPIGSLSKTFVGLAIAKLVEDGQINSIDDAANDYLTRINLPDGESSPITVEDLLTHSAGFDFTNRGLGQPKGGKLVTTITDPASKLTPLVREPGALVSYSNVGTGILGILVEDIVGTPIEEYYASKIWPVIGLNGARFHTEAGYTAETVQPFRFAEEGFDPRYFITFDPFYYAVGAVEFTLVDAARYAQFHLNGALRQPNGLLRPETLGRVQSRLRSNNNGVGGFGYQTMNFPWGNDTIIAHGGTWPGFESMLLVIPSQKVAIFFSVSGPAGLGNIDTTNAVLTELLGPAGAPGEIRETSKVEMAQYEGVYGFTLQATRGLETVLRLISPQVIQVEAVEKGLMIGGQGPFVPVGEDLFWTPEPVLNGSNIFGSSVFGFTRDADGNVVAITQHLGLAPYTKIASWRDPAFWTKILSYAAMALATGVIALFWPRGSRISDGSRLAALVAAVSPLLFIPALTASHGPGGIEAYMVEGHSGRFALAALLATLTVLASLALVLSAIRSWANPSAKEGAAWPRIHLSFLGLAASVVIASFVALGFALI